MAAKIITPEDLTEFKVDLLDNIEKLINKQSNKSKPVKWMKSPEVRKLLGLSTGTLQNLRINGTLPYTKMGGVIYYDYEKIMNVLESNMVNTTD
ncbi:DNA-binding protein [Lutibacter sp. HS1-25]|uniref:helix-turn-helix domain-containing protein n=1 Tax=Lutibacter sp. HS1-25 TaxID=2485000 RepID=UPI0010108896|nr:helix-turn-helix domain-containing protein [Lutibacter sp. HS1-25]RXP45609.1 DNA-binding protein [Lutibacter sp. HS1-25]